MEGPTPARTPARGREDAAPERDARTTDLNDPQLLFSRELSWLAFNDRILAHARNDRHSLHDRVGLLARAAGNLDAFFMVHLARLARQRRSDPRQRAADERTVEEQFQTAGMRAERMLQDIARCWNEVLIPELAGAGLRVLDPAQYSPEVTTFVAEYFGARVYPVLTPLAFEPGHPLPRLASCSKAFVIVVTDEERTRFALLRVPETLPRFIPLPGPIAGVDRTAVIFLEDVMRQELTALFSGVEVRCAHLFRVVRGVDSGLPPEIAEDLVDSPDGTGEHTEDEVTLLQADAAMPLPVLDLLVDGLPVGGAGAVPTFDRMGLSDAAALTTLLGPEPLGRRRVPRTLWGALDPKAVFERVKFGDQLVHHPFDSFSAIDALLAAAAKDPHVLTIKVALTTLASSTMVDRLVEAARRGKDVVVVGAGSRFVRRMNRLGERLERAGIPIMQGPPRTPVHCTLLLIVRDEGDRVASYVHIGTGDVRTEAAPAVTDLGLITADPDIARDTSGVFNYLTGCSKQTACRTLLVAPLGLRARFAALVDREIEHARACRPSGIIIKNNAIGDAALIRLLYSASRAGVRVDAIVRGTCCLRPGVEGVSDLIRVRSIVGPLFEHSRVYSFENGGDADVYLGSADLMPDHLDRQVDVLCPVLDPDIGHYLRHRLLQAYLRDDTDATVLHSDGRYAAIHAEGPGTVNAQELLMTRLPPEV